MRGRFTKNKKMLVQYVQQNTSLPETLDASALVTNEVAEATAEGVIVDPPKERDPMDYLEKSKVSVSSRRSKSVFTCGICSSYESKYKSVCLAHIETCLVNFTLRSEDQNSSDEDELGEGSDDTDDIDKQRDLEEEDMFLNYKNCRIVRKRI